MDGFFDGAANMFKRMVKFTPKSFTMGNMYKGVVNTALTTATFGAYQLLPKNVRKTVYNIGKVALPVVAAGAAAVALGPSVMGYLGPKLTAAGGLLGKAASSVGGSLLQNLMKLAPSKQAQIAQQVTPRDIAQAEQTGRLPAHIQAAIDQAERESYAYAVQQAQAAMRVQQAAPLVAPEYYAPDSAPVPGSGPTEGSISGPVILAASAALLLVVSR
jgi:hypothetical protein